MVRDLNPEYTITPKTLEKHLGNRCAMFMMRRNRENRSYTVGKIDYSRDGEIGMRSYKRREMIPFVHGDLIRVETKGKGFNSIRNYFFVDEPD